MPFTLMAVAKALRAFPGVNASVDGDNIVYKLDINLGVAVSLDWGLIVPVIKHADQLNLAGLARALNDLAARARARQLKPDEIQEGTFTITNPGVLRRNLRAAQSSTSPRWPSWAWARSRSARWCITDADGQDVLAIRETMFSGLSFDHRIIDGATADQFMAAVKRDLETSSFGRWTSKENAHPRGWALFDATGTERGDDLTHFFPSSVRLSLLAGSLLWQVLQL